MADSNESSIRQEIEISLSQINQAVTASLRPLPTETGDGTYVKEETKTGILSDLGRINIKDVETLIEVTKNAATGEPTNDRDYIMERVIQVSQLSLYLVDVSLIHGSWPLVCHLPPATA